MLCVSMHHRCHRRKPRSQEDVSAIGIRRARISKQIDGCFVVFRTGYCLFPEHGPLATSISPQSGNLFASRDHPSLEQKKPSICEQRDPWLTGRQPPAIKQQRSRFSVMTDTLPINDFCLQIARFRHVWIARYSQSH